MELMITVALAGVILGIGVPAFRDFAKNGRLTGAANETLVTLVAARNEAVRRQAVVSVCPSSAPDDPAATCTNTATQGFIAFVDSNSNCIRDGADMAIDVVAHVKNHSEITATKNMTCISYAASGFRRVVGGQPTTAHAMFCDNRGITKITPASNVSAARGVEILPTGRASVTRLYADVNSWSADPTFPVSCP